MLAPVFPFAFADARPVVLSDPSLDCRRHEALAAHVNTARGDAPAAWGGWGERRELYTGSELFAGEEPRVIHLGIDVWTDAGTPLAAPLDGVVHGFADNAGFGNYGPTILLDHGEFHTLWGHLSRDSLTGLAGGRRVAAGEVFAALGHPAENGGWPPHLHFQKITDVLGMTGDYPGAATEAARASWLARCPDPRDLLV